MKKSLKKFAALSLAAAMAFMVTACGGDTSSTPASTPAESQGNDSANTVVSGGATDSTWYEGQTINVYVPANASSPLGIQAMRYADWLSKTYGGNWVVTCDNTGNGTVAFETVANADPDGLTVLFTQNLLFAYYGGVYDKFATDILIPVNSGGNVIGAQIVTVPADAPYDTIDEMVEYAAANGGLMCGIQNQANSHLMSATLADKVGLDTIYVEAGGSSDKITAMLGGQIDWALLSDQSAHDYVENGDLKYILACGEVRDPVASDVPCEAELGIEPTITTSQTFWYLPLNTDPDIVATFNAMINSMTDDPELLADLANLSTEVTTMTLEEVYDFQMEVARQCKEGFASIGVDVSSKK